MVVGIGPNPFKQSRTSLGRPGSSHPETAEPGRRSQSARGMGYTAFGTPNATGTTVNIKQRYTYTGREKTTDPSLMYYRWRMYAPTLGRFTARDPIRYRGGIGLYAYVENYPINFIDPFGLEVDAVFDRTTGELTVTDRDTGATVTVPASSGSGDAKNDPSREKEKKTGPIPGGDYEILEHRDKNKYRLDPKDKKPRNDTHEDTGRDSFRLHERGSINWGCVDVDAENWKKVKDILDKTKTSTVKDQMTPWYPWASPVNEPIKKYGDLTVK